MIPVQDSMADEPRPIQQVQQEIKDVKGQLDHCVPEERKVLLELLLELQKKENLLLQQQQPGGSAVKLMSLALTVEACLLLVLDAWLSGSCQQLQLPTCHVV